MTRSEFLKMPANVKCTKSPRVAASFWPNGLLIRVSGIGRDPGSVAHPTFGVKGLAPTAFGVKGLAPTAFGVKGLRVPNLNIL